MRLIICQLLAVFVLFMSVEGAWDMANESHAHRDNLAHQVDADNYDLVDSDPLSDDADSQCGHLCHGHMSSITGDYAELVNIDSSKYYVFNSSPHSSASQAPPTPPPNA